MAKKDLLTVAGTQQPLKEEARMQQARIIRTGTERGARVTRLRARSAALQHPRRHRPQVLHVGGLDRIEQSAAEPFGPLEQLWEIDQEAL